MRDDVGEAAEELLACWADVLVRLPESPEPVYLADEEARSLADWEAEKFRLQQAR
ncbi:class II aldolase/adducin family protein [Burkholderia humptydooensis MSMB43]|uniref:Class II aldolase/adducin family protein n=1 Tax=Burkholderia humptydooensis MSMB43 TaxID=441157 RepID=A0ABN0FYG2_9BURK|nr:class II aldolase/adducin family protein [Burkholderia humptydooensis MSMB43]